MREHLSIGELSKQTGVKVVTIRYYEQTEVLPAPARTEGNYRTYSQKHVDRLRFIRRCRDLGFSIEQIGDLLRLSSENTESCSDVCTLAERHLATVEEKLADLQRLASELRRISSSCNGKGPMAECRIIGALSHP